jgi:hypothetical protein
MRRRYVRVHARRSPLWRVIGLGLILFALAVLMLIVSVMYAIVSSVMLVMP